MLIEAAQEPRAIAGEAEVMEALSDPSVMVWRGARSVVMLRVNEPTSTGEKVCEASPAAGDLTEILERGVADVEAFARHNGCTQVHVRAGRDGWERALRQHGYERTAVILRKVLD